MSEYHVPVMLQEVMEGLDIRPDGVYADLTFGGGGHAREIVSRLESGRLYGFDQDAEAAENIEGLDAEKFSFIPANFRYLKKYLRLHKAPQLDGILADLGVSSHQFDRGGRGFSIRFDGPLDMRMDQQSESSAHQVVNKYSESALIELLRQYGELRNAKQVAGVIIRHRANKEITTTEELATLLKPMARRGKENKFLAQVFQAIRIEVNEELEVLKEALFQCAEVLKPGGRLVVMSYHSLEDRLVKSFMKAGNFSGEIEKDFYGNPIRPFKPVPGKAVQASGQELATNSRARSARLRVAIKTET